MLFRFAFDLAIIFVSSETVLIFCDLTKNLETKDPVTHFPYTDIE